MRVYQCDCCEKVISDPYTVKMKEFYVGIAIPIESKRKIKIQLCDDCYKGLHLIAELFPKKRSMKTMSELSQALCKSLIRLNYTKEKISLEDDLKSVDNIFEEMADVEIMLEQCKIMFQCDKEVNKWKQKKIERLEKRLEGEN